MIPVRIDPAALRRMIEEFRAKADWHAKYNPETDYDVLVWRNAVRFGERLLATHA